MIPGGSKLLAALVVSVFAALGSVAAMADDPTPTQSFGQAKPEKDAAKLAAKMTPEEKAASKKAKRVKRLPERSGGPVDYVEKVPLSTLDIDQMNVARALAKERWAKMTPMLQMRVKEAAARKEQNELTALDEVANLSMGWPLNGDFRTKRKRALLRPLPPEQPPIGTPVDRRYREPLPADR